MTLKELARRRWWVLVDPDGTVDSYDGPTPYLWDTKADAMEESRFCGGGERPVSVRFVADEAKPRKKKART